MEGKANEIVMIYELTCLRVPPMFVTAASLVLGDKYISLSMLIFFTTLKNMENMKSRTKTENVRVHQMRTPNGSAKKKSRRRKWSSCVPKP